MAKTFQNKQIDGAVNIQDNYDFINDNNDALDVDLNDIYGQISTLVLAAANGTIGAYPITAAGTDTYTGIFAGLTYFTGLFINLQGVTDNTGVGIATLNLNGLGPQAIRVRQEDGSLREMRAGELHDEVQMIYDGLQFIVIDFGAIENRRSLENTGRKNYLINGAFDVWQRGTSFPSPGFATYNADRFKANWTDDSNFTISRITKENEDDGVYAMRVEQTTAVGVVGSIIDIVQPVDGETVKILRGKTLTASMKVKIPSGIKCDLIVTDDAGVLNFQSITGDGGVEIFETTFTVPTDRVELYVFLRIDRSSAPIGILADIQWAKLEIGDKRTPYVFKTYPEELKDCMRYYQIAPFRGIGYSTTVINSRGIPFAVPMRTTPSMVKVNSNPNGTGVDGSLDAFGAGVFELTGYSVGTYSNGFDILLNGDTTIAVGTYYSGSVTLDAEI